MVLNKVDEEGNNFYPYFENPTTVILQTTDGKIFETTKATADGNGMLTFNVRGLKDDESGEEVPSFRRQRNP
jgi:hypothetical protein